MKRHSNIDILNIKTPDDVISSGGYMRATEGVARNRGKTYQIAVFPAGTTFMLDDKERIADRELVSIPVEQGNHVKWPSRAKMKNIYWRTEHQVYLDACSTLELNRKRDPHIGCIIDKLMASMLIAGVLSKYTKEADEPMIWNSIYYYLTDAKSKNMTDCLVSALHTVYQFLELVDVSDAEFKRAILELGTT